MQPESKQPKNSNIYLIGGGIASLASAVYLIKDAKIPGENIHIIEQDETLGGALDGSGTEDKGFVIRGGRMHEEHFVCYWDLLSHIPSYDDPSISVKDESFDFNKKFITDAKARLIKDGKKKDLSSFELSLRDKIDLLRLSLSWERSLDNKQINQWFRKDFFKTNFWYLWATTFAFQQWSSLIHMRRYMRRFIHLFCGLKHLGGIMRTKYNQYHSVVVPIQRYLKEEGVHFDTSTQVLDVDFDLKGEEKRAKAFYILARDGAKQKIELDKNDYIFITLGSIVDSTAQGSWTQAPSLKDKASSGAWMLWEKISKKDKSFGNPKFFSENIDLQKWYSFTVTLKDNTFHEYMEKFTGNITGTGGLVTFTDSSWLMSIVIAKQPHFPNQPEDVKIFWGYGLFPDKKGDFVKKKMSQCSGKEILEELWYHLKLQDLMQDITESGKIECIPVSMPFIDSLFMPCAIHDRPDVVPQNAKNFAFLGQFANLEDDCVFTVEYSVRTAQTAVYELFGTTKPIPIYRSIYKPTILLKALKAINK